ncbi:helix-turn-helix domain-containing protein, partial [Mucilaginibacter polytrichastri]
SMLMETSVRRAIGTDGPADGDALLNTRQAAALICYKESTLYGLAKQNQIPHSKTRGKLLFSRNALLEWVKAKAPETNNQSLNKPGKGGEI